MVGDSVAS
jgi:hypothetical protein